MFVIRVNCHVYINVGIVQKPARGFLALGGFVFRSSNQHLCPGPYLGIRHCTL